jgi:hypothetical protein
MSTTTEIKSIKSYCDNCQGETNHEILFNKKISSGDEDYHCDTKYLTVQCRGCESVSFRQEFHDYEATYPDETDNWVHEITVTLYPQPLKNHKAFREQYLLPVQIRTVYNETLEALKSNCFLLAGVGFRAVVEAVCIDKAITGRNLETKITNLSKNRFITDKEADRLHAVRFMGNDSVHEMSVPTEKALYVVLEIIDHLINNLYIIDHHAKPVLDTFITKQEEFEELLLKKLRIFKKDDDFPLAKFLEKDMRRLNGQITIFETELINQIKLGSFKKLKVGDIKVFGTNTTDKFQHYIKT